MILAFSTNEEHIEGLRQAAAHKGYPLDVRQDVDADELAKQLSELSILVFDLTCEGLNASSVVSLLDSLEEEQVPPVLYLLDGPEDIQVIASAGSIINQDYSFVPLEIKGLAGRLEVLSMLGARRRLTMETAITDRLTGLYNRKYFLRRLEEELYRSRRYKYNVGVMVASVDFSSPGNKLTEKVGTAVIQTIARFFKGRLRRTDIVARYKWDDFAFLLPDINSVDSLLVAQDVKAKLEARPIRADDLDIKIKVFLGHVMIPVEGLDTAVDVIAALDDCCFEAKSAEDTDVVTYSGAS